MFGCFCLLCSDDGVCCCVVYIRYFCFAVVVLSFVVSLLFIVDSFLSGTGCCFVVVLFVCVLFVMLLVLYCRVCL